jgi:hypothetical protein
MLWFFRRRKIRERVGAIVSLLVQKRHPGQKFRLHHWLEMTVAALVIKAFKK